jgi:lambda repressor-like predicted transcriptional regulator
MKTKQQVESEIKALRAKGSFMSKKSARAGMARQKFSAVAAEYFRQANDIEAANWLTLHPEDSVNQDALQYGALLPA